MIYDEHNDPIKEDWARFRIESDGQVVGQYKADVGSILLAVHKFGLLDIRFFVIGPSTTAPLFISHTQIYSSDCDRIEHLPPRYPPCQLPTTLAHGTVECDGATAGAVCTFQCNAGFMLSAPQHQYMICEENGNFETSFPTCVDSFTTQSCDKREGEICQAISVTGDEFTGVCESNRCKKRDNSSFCSHLPPLPTSPDCSTCHYDCNQAFTICTLMCPNNVYLTPTATCGFGPANGGWWSGVWTDTCIQYKK